MGSSTVGVLLVDDHAVVRAGFRRLLEESGGFRVVAEAETGEDACILYRQRKPDIVVMDLSLPGIGGLEAIKRIITFDRRARIVVFTMHESPILAERAIKTGAVGYFVKRSSPEVAIDAVREAASNRVYIEPSIAQALAIASPTSRIRRIEGANPLINKDLTSKGLHYTGVEAST